MEDDNSWVFDSLVCFLNGPIWNAPLQSFIEEKSLSITDLNLYVNELLNCVFQSSNQMLMTMTNTKMFLMNLKIW